jgi:hypothetical protein
MITVLLVAIGVYGIFDGVSSWKDRKRIEEIDKQIDAAFQYWDRIEEMLDGDDEVEPAEAR